MSDMELDLENRDPNDLNDHVKVRFDDIFGEPDGAHSFDCVWKGSYKCFNCCKGCTYKLLTLLCGIPIAMLWGCEFASITFEHVWINTPYMRVYMIQCGLFQKIFGTCLQCCLQPIFESCGACFSNIKVTNIQG